MGHDPSLIEKSATCIALIEIVENCNLKCPTCYAASPYIESGEIQALALDEFWSRLESVIQRKGPIDVLQLSGGEPTIHPQMLELLQQVLVHDGIKYTLLNTNGVRLVQDEPFMQSLGRLHRSHRGFEVYLQFDGPQEAGQRQLRGADLRRLRREAIDHCARQGIPVTLAMTVTEANLPFLGDTLRFAIECSAVRGISFQPMFGSGRVPQEDNLPRGSTTSASPELSTQVRQLQASAQNGSLQNLTHEGVLVHERGTARPDMVAERCSPELPRSAGGVASLNVADVIGALIGQSRGMLTQRDFTPLPCGDPNCHTIGYLFRRGGQVMGVSKFVDFSKLQGFLKDRINFNLEDLARCGCEDEQLGQMLKSFEAGPDDLLRLFVKPFMDAWTYDQHRIDRCCVHVIGQGGKLESFCRHYAMKP